MPDEQVFRDLTFKHLRALRTVARLGSVTAAAEVLHVTPPAISTQLRGLQALVGEPLFDKHDRMRLTEYGHVLLEASDRIEAALRQCAERVDSLRAGAIGVAHLGVVSTGKYFAPAIIADFKRAHPGVDLRLRIGNRKEIRLALEADAVDYAVMGRFPEGLASLSDPLGRHPYVIIAPPDHRLAMGAASPKDLLSECWLGREPGSGTNLVAEEFFARYCHGQPLKRIEMGTNETIKQAVMAGLGVAVISGHTVIAELESGRLAQIRAEGMPMWRNWHLVRRADRRLSAAAARFREFLLEHRARYIAQSLPSGL